MTKLMFQLQYIVEFLDEETVAVVPNTWMTGLDSCLWSPKTSEWKSKLDRLVKCKSKPEDCFETYNVQVLCSSGKIII